MTLSTPIAPAATVAPHREDRPTLLTGAVAGVVLLLTAFVSGPDGPPVATGTPPEIRTFLADNAAALQIATAGGLLAVAALLVFVASLTRLIRNHLPRSVLADVVLGAGGLLTVLLFLTVATTSLTLLLPDLIGSDRASVDDDVLRGWYALSGFTHFLGDLQMAPLALLFGAFSIAALRARMVARWVAVVGAGLAACAVAGLAGILSTWSPLYVLWFVALFGWLVWTLLVSIAFLVRWHRLRR